MVNQENLLARQAFGRATWSLAAWLMLLAAASAVEPQSPAITAIRAQTAPSGAAVQPPPGAAAWPETTANRPQPPVFGGQPLPGTESRFAAKPVDSTPFGLQWRILQNPNGPHTALFFDPDSRVFAVYQVDSGSGQITLKSVRNLAADLQLSQFGTSQPTPKEIRQMLEEAR